MWLWGAICAWNSAMSWVWPWAVRMSHPSPNVQIMMLSIMDLDQSSYFRCRERLHLDLVPTVSCFHCGDKQAISFCESSWQFPDLSAVQLRSALCSDQGWAEQGMLGLCTLAKAWRDESRGGRKGKWEEKKTCRWQPSALRNESCQLCRSSRYYLLGTTPSLFY